MTVDMIAGAQLTTGGKWSDGERAAPVASAPVAGIGTAASRNEAPLEKWRCHFVRHGCAVSRVVRMNSEGASHPSPVMARDAYAARLEWSRRSDEGAEGCDVEIVK